MSFWKFMEFGETQRRQEADEARGFRKREWEHNKRCYWDEPYHMNARHLPDLSDKPRLIITARVAQPQLHMIQ